ncbi:hypothetical protein LSAT2_022024 [Lamellibrachia satsuma]|nr:hypothetical protein LSAT2_022024 [Lamellibrachia satsuma]
MSPGHFLNLRPLSPDSLVDKDRVLTRDRCLIGARHVSHLRMRRRVGDTSSLWCWLRRRPCVDLAVFVGPNVEQRFFHRGSDKEKLVSSKPNTTRTQASVNGLLTSRQNRTHQSGTTCLNTSGNAMVVCSLTGTRTLYGLCVLAVLGTVCVLVAGYGKGSPKASCKTLEPNHYGAKPQTSASPYSIEVVAVTSEGKAKVRISGTDIMGFVIHACDDNDSVVGSFADLPPLTTTIACREEGDTWSHADKSLKTDLEANWVPPPRFTGPVQFKGSVLRNETTYWTNLTAPHFVGAETVTDTATDSATGDSSQQDMDSDVAAATAGHTSRSNEL